MAHNSTNKTNGDSETKSRSEEILDMLARVPVDMLETECLRLLNATRHVSQGRDLPMIEEPDNAIRLKVWQTIVEQTAGAAGSRKPMEPIKSASDDKPEPGMLRVKSGSKSDTKQIQPRESNTGG